MARTIINLVLPYTFCDEGDYRVSLDGRLADIKVEYMQNTETLDKITGIVSMGKVTSRPDDPDGFSNLSKVTILLPFLTTSTVNDLAQKNAFDKRIDAFETENILFEDVRKECVWYLNRIRTVIRYFTRRYWIREIAESHLHIYKFRAERDDGTGRTYFSFLPLAHYKFPIQVVEQSDVQEEINEMLKNEAIISLSDRLYLDSLNFFAYGRYQEAIIDANIAMEVGLSEQVRKLALNSGFTVEQSDKVVDDINSPTRFEYKLKRAFFRTTAEKEFEKMPIFKELEKLREKRGNVVHHGVRFFNEEQTRAQLLKIYEYISWIKNQRIMTYP